MAKQFCLYRYNDVTGQSAQLDMALTTYTRGDE